MQLQNFEIFSLDSQRFYYCNLEASNSARFLGKPNVKIELTNKKKKTKSAYYVIDRAQKEKKRSMVLMFVGVVGGSLCTSNVCRLL